MTRTEPCIPSALPSECDPSRRQLCPNRPENVVCRRPVRTEEVERASRSCAAWLPGKGSCCAPRVEDVADGFGIDRERRQLRSRRGYQISENGDVCSVRADIDASSSEHVDRPGGDLPETIKDRPDRIGMLLEGRLYRGYELPGRPGSWNRTDHEGRERRRQGNRLGKIRRPAPLVAEVERPNTAKGGEPRVDAARRPVEERLNAVSETPRRVGGIPGCAQRAIAVQRAALEPKPLEIGRSERTVMRAGGTSGRIPARKRENEARDSSGIAATPLSESLMIAIDIVSAGAAVIVIPRSIEVPTAGYPKTAECSPKSRIFPGANTDLSVTPGSLPFLPQRAGLCRS
jgi:hypothetical protein